MKEYPFLVLRLPGLVLLLAVAGGCGPRDPEAPSGTLLAEPNPVRVCDHTGLGKTRIAWFREEFGLIEVRVGSPAGRVLTRSGPHGSVETGKWVRDGMPFFLLDVERGRVLASVTVAVTSAGCDRRATG